MSSGTKSKAVILHAWTVYTFLLTYLFIIPIPRCHDHLASAMALIRVFLPCPKSASDSYIPIPWNSPILPHKILTEFLVLIGTKYLSSKIIQHLQYKVDSPTIIIIHSGFSAFRSKEVRYYSRRSIECG